MLFSIRPMSATERCFCESPSGLETLECDWKLWPPYNSEHSLYSVRLHVVRRYVAGRELPFAFFSVGCVFPLWRVRSLRKDLCCCVSRQLDISRTERDRTLELTYVTQLEEDCVRPMREHLEHAGHRLQRATFETARGPHVQTSCNTE